ncbi:MAG: hypothetical protein MZV64_04795 [Ignavibacteriales bacterium]|nr:hypothetical protein [Ignavibacteriales bacterium]
MGVSIDVTDRRRAEEMRRVERGAPGGGRRPRRPRVLRGGLRPAARSTSTTGSASICGLPPDQEQGLQAAGVLDRAPAPGRPRSACWTQREQLHDGKTGAARRRVSLPASDPRREVDSSHGPRHSARRRPAARSGRTASSATSPEQTAGARRPCGSRTRRSSG